MKRMKQLLGLLLAVCVLVSSMVLPVSAAADDEEMLQVLALLAVMNGDEKGNLNLDRQVTRAEFAKMSIAASPLREQGKTPGGISPFSDVSSSHWASGYITAVRNAGWFQGGLDGAFRPDAGITLAEAVTVVLRMLGYTDADFSGPWPNGQMALYEALELDEQIDAEKSQKISRRDCGRLIYNLLSTPTKDGTVYCTAQGYTLNAEGNIDLLTLSAMKLEGPVVAEKDKWISQIGFTPKKILLNGNEKEAKDIKAYHVLYHQEGTGTVYAYSTRHSGTINAISPNMDNPTAVTVGGITYPLGSSGAALSLSIQGEFRKGDRVTLLMGRNDAVAAIIAGDISVS